jgi:ethanolamine utilization microcompartment shell protein EutL
MVIVSPFPETRTRATVESAAIRNECVAALADSLLILYASPGSKTEEFSRILITGNRRPVWTLANPANQILLNLGARPAGEGLPFVQRHSVGK